MLQFDRHRRLRTSTAMRDLVRETHLNKDDLIMPVFVDATINGREEIPSMPGIYRYSLDSILDEITEIVKLGIKSIIIADTCLCEYTSTGHCGILKDGVVLNDESLKYLTKTAVSQVKAGADIIAPSNAMDGYVAAIRQGLDEAGYKNTPIMSYAVKFASSFYGPFRDAADGSPKEGPKDRKTYQMDPANRLEALREVASDEKEGADFVMVKPAMAFLDIMREVRNHTLLPLVAYNVSGEYAMIKAAAANGWINENQIVYESLVGMKRAGADLIITYFAKDVAKKL